MKQTAIIFFIVALAALSSCSTKSPEELATECCDCWNEMRSYSNPTKQLNKVDECTVLVRKNSIALKELGVVHDWDATQVMKAEEKFNNIYKKCE